MRAIPNCLRCGGTMQVGFILDRTRAGNDVSTWVEGYPERSLLMGLKLRDRANLPCVTFRCVDCGCLDSYAPKPESS